MKRLALSIAVVATIFSCSPTKNNNTELPTVIEQHVDYMPSPKDLMNGEFIGSWFVGCEPVIASYALEFYKYKGEYYSINVATYATERLEKIGDKYEVVGSQYEDSYTIINGELEMFDREGSLMKVGYTAVPRS